MANNLLKSFDLKKIDFSKLNLFQNPLKMFFPKKMIGVDIGTGSIKIVELSKWGQGKTLENYGEIRSLSLYKDSFQETGKGSYLLSNYFIARAIMAVLDEAKIKTKQVIFAVPDFKCFSMSFELPPMSAKELPEAVYYSAPQYIPLPVSESTLDWKLIKGNPGTKSSLKIFLVAIPNQVINDYKSIAQLAGLELYAVESEAMALARVFVRDKKQCVCLVDIGMQSTTINIVHNNLLKKSYSFDFSGSHLGRTVASVMGVDEKLAEEVKNEQGILVGDKSVKDALYLMIDPLLIEVKRVLSDFASEEGQGIDMVYLTGGTALLPGLRDYFKETLKIRVETPNCFADVLYPPILGQKLEKLSPSFAVATGISLGGLENQQ